LRGKRICVKKIAATRHVACMATLRSNQFSIIQG
jgi:hypothetical protein